MANEPVGVLIIGAGASGGAFAWSIADAGMSVLCLEQGPWMQQSTYPTNGLDFESRAMGEFSASPNVRGLAQDYPVNQDYLAHQEKLERPDFPEPPANQDHLVTPEIQVTPV